MSIRKDTGSFLSSDLLGGQCRRRKEPRPGLRQAAARRHCRLRQAGWVQIVDEYYDEAVSGADHIDTRPGFKAMLERLLSNGVRTIVVETANRFARDLMVQEVGFAMLKERGITLIAADSPDAFLDDTPTSRLIRQVLGSVSEFEKAMLVSKLRGARERKRANGHKVEGRKSHAEARPEVVALAKTLRQRLHRGYAMSFRDISAELFALGHASKSGKAFTASSVRKMLV